MVHVEGIAKIKPYGQEKSREAETKVSRCSFCLSIMKAGWMVRLEWDQMKKEALNFIVKCLCLLGRSEATVEL